MHTRGLSGKDIDALMYRISLDKLQEATAYTSSCLVAYTDGLGVDIRRVKSGFIVNFLKEKKDNG